MLAAVSGGGFQRGEGAVQLDSVQDFLRLRQRAEKQSREKDDEADEGAGAKSC